MHDVWCMSVSCTCFPRFSFELISSLWWVDVGGDPSTWTMPQWAIHSIILIVWKKSETVNLTKRFRHDSWYSLLKILQAFNHIVSGYEPSSKSVQVPIIYHISCQWFNITSYHITDHYHRITSIINDIVNEYHVFHEIAGTVLISYLIQFSFNLCHLSDIFHNHCHPCSFSPRYRKGLERSKVSPPKALLTWMNEAAA